MTALLALLALASSASAQTRAASAAILIRNATVLTVTKGTLANTDVLVSGGKITQVGKSLAAPAGANVIDGTGKFVMPGIIDPHSHMALDAINEGSLSVTSMARIRDVINPTDPNIYRALAGGVTTINALHGSANTIGGQNAVLKLKWGRPADEMLFPGAMPGIKFALGENVTRKNSGAIQIPGIATPPRRYPTTRMGQEEVIRDALLRARDYKQSWDDYRAKYAKDKTAIAPRRDLELEPLAEVLEGKRFVHAHSYRGDEMLMLLQLADEFGFRVQTLQHGLEGYKIADEIAKRGTGLSTFADEWSYKIEAYDAIPYNVAILMRHGVLATINSDDDGRARRLNIDAAKLIRYGGLTEDEALSTITINGAKQLGIDKKVGSIEVGKDADLAIYNGNPLSVYSSVDYTIIDGEVFFDKAKDLANRDVFAKEKADLEKADVNMAPAGGRGGRGGPPGAVATPPEKTIMFKITQRAAVIPNVVRNLSALGALTVFAATSANAQLGSYNPAPGPQGTFAIRNAHIFPVSGAEIQNGTIVISNGKIQAIGTNVNIPSGAQVIDGTGLNVYPGMMDAGTSIGLSEIPQGAASTVDISETGSFNPNVQAYYAINPHSAHVGVARVVGITHVISRPTGGIISGQAALIYLAGWTTPAMTVNQKMAMFIDLPGGGGRGGRGGGGFGGGGANPADAAKLRTRQLDSLKQLFRDADAYGKSMDAYAKDKTLPRPKHDAVLESMVPMIRGQQEVMMTAETAAEIREAVTFAEEMKIKPIIVGGREAPEVASFLKQHDISVLYSSVLQLPRGEDDAYDKNYSGPAKLAAAGVKFAITSGDCCSEVRNLPSIAGMASAFGLSKADALKAVTLGPAQIFGVSDKLGSLDIGKIANVVVTDGDMLEARTNTRYLFIDGRMVPLDTKHSQLYDEFKGKPLVP